ncbi:biotin synthase BioB, partial [Staphylococcus xylosus]|nr:biotin synthase BioB [Staphylococcus xylosus]
VNKEVNLRSLQLLALKATNSIFVGDYLVTGGQPNKLNYKMIEDLGFKIDFGNH